MTVETSAAASRETSLRTSSFSPTPAAGCGAGDAQPSDPRRLPAEERSHGLSNGESFRSQAALTAFALEYADIAHLDGRITAAAVCQALPALPRSAFSAGILSDGVLCIEGNYLDTRQNQLWVAVPGIGRRIARITIDPQSREITALEACTRPELIKGLLLQSQSPIALELMRRLDAAIEPDMRLEGFLRTVEVGENEAVIVDSSGNAILIGVAAQASPPGARVCGMRSGVKTVQSQGLRYCGGLIVRGQSVGILLHGRGDLAFELLLRESLKLAQRVETPAGRVSAILCRSSDGVISAGAGELYMEYERIARNVLGMRCNEIAEFDTNSYSLNVQTRQALPDFMRLPY